MILLATILPALKSTVVERFEDENYAGRLLNVLNNQIYPVTRLICGKISLFYYGFVESFISESAGSKETGLRSYGDLLNIHSALHRNLLQIQSAKNPFSKLLQLTKLPMKKHHEEFHRKVSELFSVADSETTKKVNQEVYITVGRLLEKYSKEDEPFRQMGLDQSTLLPVDNRGVGTG